MQDAFPFKCKACKGTGQRLWGHCKPCGGHGGFKTSPEVRAKKRERRMSLKREGAQQANRDTSVYLGVMNRQNVGPLFVQMRVDHDAGRCWTPAQISSARSKLQGIREARQMFGDASDLGAA